MAPRSSILLKPWEDDASVDSKDQNRGGRNTPRRQLLAAY